MERRLFLVLAAGLLLLRLPALVQPMGADQGLYAYVGERIRFGELPYRDAWDQKPPAIHYLYAGLRMLSPGGTAVGAADLCAAGLTAWLLLKLGTTLGQALTGQISSLLFLLLANPAFTRLGGIRLRSQCETFIAVAVSGAFLLLARRYKGAGPAAALGAGLLFGVAFVFKYNAGLYVVAGMTSLYLWRRLMWPDAWRLAAGFAIPVAVTVVLFASAGALHDLYGATIAYNMEYSGETYASSADVLRYLVSFPVQHARVDGLWTLGGAGCLILITGAGASRERLMPVIWVVAAVLTIAVNGSRGLPQYFVQANPALALAAGWGAVVAWSAMRSRLPGAARLVGAAMLLLIVVAVWRVNQFPKLVEQTLFDARYALGSMPRRDYLTRYVDGRKYSALAAADLSDLVRARTQPGDRIYVFGFTCEVYVTAERASASRFFWSRPVIAGFNAGTPGYGIDGLLSDLLERPPAVVALQRKDWAPDVTDSADFFMATPPLADFLRARYDPTPGTDAFAVWVRKAGPS